MSITPVMSARSRGFTLLEILVVMVIVGLMVSLIPPMFSGAVSGTKIKGSMRDLAVTMRESRSRAIIQNRQQRIHLDLENHQYKTENGNTTTLPAGMSVDLELITGDRIQNIDKHVIYFFPDGSSSGEMITLSGGNHVYHLHLDWLTGNITFSSGADHAG